jgi:hypothetical protein
MKEKKEFKLFGGEIVRKCPLEHFTPQQFIYGSPYTYIIEYSDKQGGSPKMRYALWKFDENTLKYKLFQTAGEKEYDTLDKIVTEWERVMWAEKATILV